MTLSGELYCPAFSYGGYRAANAAAGRFATKLKRGATIEEAAGPLMSVADDPDAWIVVARRWSAIDSRRSHFNVDRPWRLLTARVELADVDTFDRVRKDCLGHAWSFAGIVASEEYRYVRRADWQLELIEAARRHLPVLERVGARFSVGHAPSAIARVAHLVGFALHRQGFVSPVQGLSSRLLETEGDRLPGLAVKQALASGDVGAAVRLLAGHPDVVVCSLAEHFLSYGLDREACEAIRGLGVADPHGTVERWLSGGGDPTRVVR